MSTNKTLLSAMIGRRCKSERTGQDGTIQADPSSTEHAILAWDDGTRERVTRSKVETDIRRTAMAEQKLAKEVALAQVKPGDQVTLRYFSEPERVGTYQGTDNRGFHKVSFATGVEALPPAVFRDQIVAKPIVAAAQADAISRDQVQEALARVLANNSI